jgi:class 3 adenylate cyclase/rhodanese-related sulfurtransferase
VVVAAGEAQAGGAQGAVNPARLAPDALHRRLAAGERLVVLDARRGEALARSPRGVPGAVPVLLDEPAPRIPDLPRDTPIAVYCLCSGQASSTRVALSLQQAGYSNVLVLEGGLPAWEAAGLALAEVSVGDRRKLKWMDPPRAPAAQGDHMIAERAFLAGAKLPVRREMAVMFVDMVDSTHLLFAHEPDAVLRLVQAFMAVVVDVAVQHCGDVHDFEGDGAMLYFAGAGEAVPAAFKLRNALADLRRRMPEVPQARFALDAGPLVIGRVGSHERRSLSFIGPSVNTAARILKLAPAGGIAATEQLVSQARRTDPDLAAHFRALPERQVLKGFAAPVAVFVAIAGDDCGECHG